jgi:CO/xanthine dehydrogenase FAD-binding subunit
MKKFAYRKVSTLDEALRLVTEHGGKARILAGGTDLMGKIRYSVLKPEILIDLKGVAGLDGIGYSPRDGLTIGALATIHSLEISAVVKEKFPVIAQAAAALGSFQIRCRATLGGNLCNASPAADLVPGLLALGAEVVVAGANGDRRLPLENFFIGPGATALGPAEIVTGIRIPDESRFLRCTYLKHTVRNALDVPLVGVAAGLRFDSDGCSAAKVALGAVGPVPFRARKAEECLLGGRLDASLIASAALIASEEARPVDDIRASAEYRRDMVRVLTGRALQSLWENLTGGKTAV